MCGGVVSKTKHSETKTEARSTQNSKTKHPNLENEAPKTRKRSTLDRKRRPQNLENEALKTRNYSRFNKCNFNFIIGLTILDTSYLNFRYTYMFM